MVVVLRSVGPWLGRWGVWGVFGVHYPKFRSFGEFAYGDRGFLVFWDVIKRFYYSFVRSVCEVVALYVCMPSFCVVLWEGLV